MTMRKRTDGRYHMSIHLITFAKGRIHVCLHPIR